MRLRLKYCISVFILLIGGLSTLSVQLCAYTYQASFSYASSRHDAAYISFASFAEEGVPSVRSSLSLPGKESFRQYAVTIEEQAEPVNYLDSDLDDIHCFTIPFFQSLIDLAGVGERSRPPGNYFSYISSYRSLYLLFRVLRI